MIVRILTTTLAIVSFVSVAGWLSSSTSPMLPGANPANGFTPSIPTACYALPLACELRIELPDQIKRSAVGDYKIQIHNVGAVRVTLVQPGTAVPREGERRLSAGPCWRSIRKKNTL